MKAVVKVRRGEGNVELLDVEEPSPVAGTALVRVRAAGICGSDLMILHDRFPGYRVPVTLGHEFAGEIEEVGHNVTGLSVGDRVACETHAYVCGRCDYCRSGAYNLCQSRLGFGYGVDGAFAKFVVVREAIIHHLPEGVGTREAALLEPLSVVVNALTRNSRLLPGESVLVIGPGPIGIISLLVAKMSGCDVTVSGTERSSKRLSIAESLGADEVVTDSTVSGGHMENRFDVVVIAAGEPSTFETALKCCKPGGRVVHIGESTAKATFMFSLIDRKNITVNGSFSHNWPVWEKAILLAKEGKVNLRPLITHEFALEEWKSAFSVAESKEGMKVLLRP